MNNNTPDNNDLNAVSLGSVDNTNANNVPVNDLPPVSPIPMDNSVTPMDNQNINVVPPVEPVAPVDTNEVVDTLGVETPVNNVPIMDNNVPPVSPIPPVNYDVPGIINDVNTTPLFNDIGTVPPIDNGTNVPPINNNISAEPKKKKNKLLFIIIIVLLITAVGVGVYIFLSMSNFDIFGSKKKTGVELKNVEVDINEEIPTDINAYATFNNIDSSSCTLDTSKIPEEKTLNEEYEYTITCNSVTYTGKITFVDKTVPAVVLKDEVTVQVNGTVTPEDFIVSCDDATKCSYKFKDETAVDNSLKAAGNYHVTIVISDEAGNEIEMEGTMVVTEEEVALVDYYLSCSINRTNYTEKLKLGMKDNNFTRKGEIVYTFVLDATTYNELKSANANKTEMTYNEVTGVPTFNDATYTLVLTKSVTYDDLNTDGSLPIPYGELRTYYTNLKYTCGIER